MAANQQRVAVVTGAAQGIGRAFSERLAATGFAIVLADINEPVDTHASVEAHGAPVISVAVDISDEVAVAGLGAAALEHFGRVDILVNNAGTGAIEDFESITFESWRQVLAVNLDSLFLTSKIFLPGMRQRGWGRIVNMASNTLGLVVPWGFAHYIASKGGVIGLTRALASEYGEHGITVNAISPGLTRSPGTISLFGETDAFATAQAIKRPQVVEDLVGTLSFLVSDDAAFITGQTITVDGGLVR